MFAKILYPTDFSDVSKKALAYLKRLKEAGAKEIVILHVIDERKIEAITIYGNSDSFVFIEEIEQEARKEVTAIKGELKKCGFEVKTRIEKGIPLKEILRIEEQEKVSLVVIGSHGKTNIKEMLMGSVSEKVVRRAKNPVLVIKR